MDRPPAYGRYVTFSDGAGPHDGVELLLTTAGVRYARNRGHSGSLELARWLMAPPRWQGSRTAKNVAGEIAMHALFANWPVIGRRANPVNIEYYQTWPLSLVTRLRDAMLRRLR